MIRQAYQVTVFAGSGLLLGGATTHVSAPFASPRDADSWAATVIDTNRKAGCDASHARIDDVRVPSSSVIPESDHQAPRPRVDDYS